MSRLAIERGVEVESRGSRFVITHVLDFDAVMAQELATGRMERLPIADLKVPSATKSVDTVPDLSVLDGNDWDEARRRQRVIKALMDLPRRSRADAIRAAADLDVEVTTVYRWLRVYQSTGKLSSLLPHRPTGGRGKSRMNEDADRIIKIAIENFYLTKQQPTVRATADEVARLCRASGLKPPHPNTVRSRVMALAEETRLKRRAHGKSASDRFTARPGKFDEAQHPLSVVQIDHTKLDIVLVDAIDRLSIGRPWITLAFDVFSRMVVGFFVSLDPPSASTTGLALAHAILPKETWLAKRNISNSWPCWGFPARLHLDNAKEFRGEMLRRACEEYGIEINFRPVATPHFGGHIERMLGTLARALHELPGTTFSNPKQRGDYDSDSKASMTLPQLETWIAEYITGVYHRKVHGGIHQAPLERWTEAILGSGRRVGVGMIARPADEDRIRLDFMPFVERTIQPYGVRIDEIHYYSDILRPYINASSGKKRTFTFRRDPRDISAIYFWDPDLLQYCAVPYRDMSHPAMSIWELRDVRRRLEEEGRLAVDEASIFESYERLRVQRENAVQETKRTRRSRERRDAVKRFSKPGLQPKPALKPLSLPRSVEAFEIDDI